MIRLGLTEEQAKKMVDIFSETEDKIAIAGKEILGQPGGTTPNREAMAAYEKRKTELIQAEQKMVNELLTDEQRARFDAGLKARESFFAKDKKLQEEMAAAYLATGTDPEKYRASKQLFKDRSKALLVDLDREMDEKVGKANPPKAFEPAPEKSSGGATETPGTVAGPEAEKKAEKGEDKAKDGPQGNNK